MSASLHAKKNSNSSKSGHVALPETGPQLNCFKIRRRHSEWEALPSARLCALCASALSIIEMDTKACYRRIRRILPAALRASLLSPYFSYVYIFDLTHK
jgi:hypothetical protein